MNKKLHRDEMKFFSLIFKNDDVAPSTKVLSPEAFSSLLDAKELLVQTQKDSASFIEKTKQECEELRKQAKEEGFKEGQDTWSAQLAFLEKEQHTLHEQMKQAIVPLAIASVKKIIGKELETNPDTIISIITKALKEVTQQKRIVIYVNPQDLSLVEQARPELKQIVEYADSLIVTAKADVVQGSCIIETETGIVNAQLDVQLAALERAFSSILQKQTQSQESTPQ